MMTRGEARRILPCILSGLFIAFFTLRPAGEGPAGLRPGGYLLTDLILNVILFAPMGLALGLAGARPRSAAAIGLLASAAIELAQLSWIPGRDASLHDIVTNTAGTWLGALIVAHWGARTRLWRAIGPAAAAAIVLAWVGGAFLLSPSLPSPQRWYAQWAHGFGDQEPFTGRVLSLSLQGIPLPDGLIDHTTELHDVLVEADTIRLATTIISGPPAPGNSQIAAVLLTRGNETFGVWQDGAALIARSRLRLTDAGLRTPGIRLDGALPSHPGDTVRISFLVDRQAMRLTAEQSTQTFRAVMRLSPDLFWSAFLPFDWQGGTGARWWPLLPALLSYLMLGMALGRHPGLLGLAAAVTVFGGPLFGAGGFPDLAALLIAGLGPALGLLAGRRLSLYTQEGPPR